MRRWLDARRHESCQASAAIVPLLFEAGMECGWDVVVCVSARESVQMRRLLDRKITVDEARQRIAAQWPVERKAERADFVLVNNGAEELLLAQTRRMIKRILEMEKR